MHCKNVDLTIYVERDWSKTERNMKKLFFSHPPGGIRKMMCTLLLTGTIAPEVFAMDHKRINVSLTDAKERLTQYKDTIKKYMEQSPFTDIVFIDNSDYGFPVQEYQVLAHNLGKRFEFISQQLSEEEREKVLLRGKSYGEALLIEKAMRESRLIENTEVIYKSTGRVFCLNSKSLIILKEGTLVNEFLAIRRNKWLVTYFFKLIKSDYFKYLSETIDEMDDYNGKQIEKVWYKRCLESDMKVKAFRRYPHMHGMKGGDPGQYDLSKSAWFMRDIMCMFTDYYKLK